MSTSWNLACLDHPHASYWLEEGWSGSGDRPAEEIAGLWRRRETVFRVADLARHDDMLSAELEYDYRKVTPTMVRWARWHTDCRLELVGEHGYRRALDSMQPLPPRHCRTCTCEPR